MPKEGVIVSLVGFHVGWRWQIGETAAGTVRTSMVLVFGVLDFESSKQLHMWIRQPSILSTFGDLDVFETSRALLLTDPALGGSVVIKVARCGVPIRRSQSGEEYNHQGGGDELLENAHFIER